MNNAETNQTDLTRSHPSSQEGQLSLFSSDRCRQDRAAQPPKRGHRFQTHLPVHSARDRDGVLETPSRYFSYLCPIDHDDPYAYTSRVHRARLAQYDVEGFRRRTYAKLDRWLSSFPKGTNYDLDFLREGAIERIEADYRLMLDVRRSHREAIRIEEEASAEQPPLS